MHALPTSVHDGAKAYTGHQSLLLMHQLYVLPTHVHDGVKVLGAQVLLSCQIGHDVRQQVVDGATVAVGLLGLPRTRGRE